MNFRDHLNSAIDSADIGSRVITTVTKNIWLLLVTPRIFRVWRTTYPISTKIAKYVYPTLTPAIGLFQKKTKQVGGGVEGGISRG